MTTKRQIMSSARRSALQDVRAAVVATGLPGAEAGAGAGAGALAGAAAGGDGGVAGCGAGAGASVGSTRDNCTTTRRFLARLAALVFATRG